MTSKNNLSSPQKTFRILEKLAQMQGASFSELADEFEYPVSTVNDHVRTLKNIGYIVEDEDKIRVGTKFLKLGENARKSVSILDEAKPQVEELAEQIGEYASFCIEENGDCVVLHTEKGSDAVDFGLYTGQRVPLTSTSAGKALIIHNSKDEIERFLNQEGEADVESEELMEELQIIKQQGYAQDTENRLDGIRSIAAPIVCDGDVRGAITIGGSKTRLDNERYLEELPKIIRESANKIEVKVTHAADFR
jgi:DNA-binding IclR family transcriptional regulator